MSNPHKPEGPLVCWTDAHREAVRDIPEPPTYLEAQRAKNYWEVGKLVDGGPVPPKGRSV
jgi:hypothetical protein